MESPSSLRVYPPIYRLGKVGISIRETLMAGIHKGTPVLLQIESFRRPHLTKFMKLIAFMGEEEFYTLLLPFITWMCDYKLGCLLAVLMAFGFYIGGSIKNVLCLPRPPSPPVTPADKCNDWSMPSHHAILNVTVPWYVWIYIYTRFDWSTGAVILAFMGVSFWCFSILFSRLYLGVHSPADILVGGVLGCLILISYLMIEDSFQSMLGTSTRFTILYVIIAIILLSIHPDPKPQTFIVIETANMVSATCGAIIGAWVNVNLNVHLSTVEYNNVMIFVGRYLLGMLFLISAKEVVTGIVKRTLMIFLPCIGLPCVYVRRKTEVNSAIVHYSPKTFIVLDKPDSDSKKGSILPLNIYFVVKIITMMILGWITTSGGFILFNLFDI